MPAIAPFLVHASSDGVRMSDVGLRGDEDYLLVHSVEDAADWKGEIERFGITGEKVYHALQDPYLTFSFDADCLAFEGLANCHPGRTVTAASINNIIPGAFGWDGANRIYVYRRPRRRRSGAQLASINFEIEVHNSSFTAQYDNGLSPLTWTDPSTVLISSPNAFVPAVSYFGATIFWRRRGTIDRTAFFDPSNLLGLDIREYCQSWPVASTKPADLAAFLVSVDSQGDETGSSIVEIFDVTTGQHFLEDSQGNQLPTLLANGTNPIDAQVFPNTACRWAAVWRDTSGTEHVAGDYFGSEANLAAFQVAHPDDAFLTLAGLYDMKKSMTAFP